MNDNNLEIHSKKYRDKFVETNYPNSQILIPNADNSELELAEPSKEVISNEHYLNKQKFNNEENIKRKPTFSPNKLQQEAIVELNSLRARGGDRALVISATATGKT